MYRKTLSAYITNLGKYVEGELVGKWVDFPAASQEIQNVLKEIGVDCVQYEEIFVTDYESDISGLTDCLGEYESLSMLNYLANKVQESDCSTEQLEALIEYGEYTGSIEELITLLDNTDCYLMYDGIEDDYDLGYYYIHETGLFHDLSKTGSVLANYIDYEAYGRDVRLEEGGVYTQHGYVCLIGSPDTVDVDDIPEEYRIKIA